MYVVSRKHNLSLKTVLELIAFTLGDIFSPKPENGKGSITKQLENY